MKTIIFLIFCVTIPFLGKGQDRLEGEFRRTSTDTKEIIEFKLDGTFSYFEESCGLAYSGKGRYTLNRKTLSLDFDPQLEKTIGIFSAERKKDTTNLQSTVQVFEGYKHRNDIQFNYVLYRNNGIQKEGSCDAYNDLHFYPNQVDSVLIKTYFISNDSLILYQENKISIDSTVAYKYTLLTLPKEEPMVVGKSYNREYRIKLNKAKTKFKIRDDSKTWMEYKLIPQ